MILQILISVLLYGNNVSPSSYIDDTKVYISRHKIITPERQAFLSISVT